MEQENKNAVELTSKQENLGCHAAEKKVRSFSPRRSGIYRHFRAELSHFDRSGAGISKRFSSFLLQIRADLVSSVFKGSVLKSNLLI